MTDQTPLTDDQLQRIAGYVHPDAATDYVRAWLHSMARELLDARARDARALSLIRLLWDSRRLWQDFADADAEDADRYEVLAVLRGVDKAALRSRVAELEAEVTTWQGMYRVASDHRAQNLSDYQEAARIAAWFAAEKDHWVERVAMGFQPWGRRVSELEAELLEARAEAGAMRGDAAALQARVMELQTQVAARDARIHEWRVHLAEIADALDLPEDTRFDCLPEEVRTRIAELEAAQSEPIGYTLATPTASGEWTFGRHYYRRRPAAESAARYRPPAWRVIELREVSQQ